MAKIGKLELAQLNPQLDKIDQLEKRIASLEASHKSIVFQSAQLDFVHARPTVNNLVFTWTGATTTLSWAAGWIKDKNAALDTGTAYSQAPSFKFRAGSTISHNISIPAGSLVLASTTYYWLGWDTDQLSMIASKNASELFKHHNLQIICQLFTGTAGQTGVAGGGGNQGVGYTDLSGARYKLF